MIWSCQAGILRYIAWNGRRGLGLCSSAALIKCLHACFQINAFRFDDTEVLGDRIEMSWFKDLRKAKQQGGYTFHERLRKLNYKCDLSIITYNICQASSSRARRHTLLCFTLLYCAVFLFNSNGAWSAVWTHGLWLSQSSLQQPSTQSY